MRSTAPRAATTDPLSPRDIPPRAASGVLAAGLLLSYLVLAPPVSGGKDASEMALALATGGVIHPTGYPLYTILGHGFVRLLHMMGVAFSHAANMWAALGGGVAMFLYHRLALRLIPPSVALPRTTRFALAAVPVLVLGFNPVWMVECTVVEVHSWQIAWLCGTMLTFVGLLAALEHRPSGRDLAPRMAAWGLLCGLGGANHVTAIFAVAGLTTVLAWTLARSGRLHVWVPAIWLAAGVLPLLSYGYIHDKAVDPGDAAVWPMLSPDWKGVLDHVTARAYRMYLGAWAPDDAQAAWLNGYVHPFLWPGLIGLLVLGYRTRESTWRRLASGFLLVAVAQTVFAFRYGVSDPAAYFLPALVVALLSIPWAAAVPTAALARSRWRLVVATATVVVVLAAYVVPSVAAAAARRTLNIEVEAYVHGLWRSIPYEHGIVVWPNDQYYRLKQYQVFQGEKPGLDVCDTEILFNDNPRRVFMRRYGFDPLAIVDQAHLSQPLNGEFVIGERSSADETHAFALVHEYLTLKAGIPVIAFDPPKPIRAWVPYAVQDTADSTAR